jgi:hypothetical protein
VCVARAREFVYPQSVDVPSRQLAAQKAHIMSGSISCKLQEWPARDVIDEFGRLHIEVGKNSGGYIHISS